VRKKHREVDVRVTKPLGVEFGEFSLKPDINQLLSR
jgi:hypothetical protein